MPAITQSDHAKNYRKAIPYPGVAGAVMALRASIAFTANPTANDIAEFLAIPAGCRVVDIVVDADDMDTDASPTLVFDVGFISGEFGAADGARTVGSEFFAASTAGQTGVAARPTKPSAYRDAKSNAVRGIGIKFGVAAKTFGAGTIGITVFYVAD